MEIKELAAQARAYFETAQRTNGDHFWKCKDDAPEWVEALCLHAHEGMPPDDHRYEFIVDSLDLIRDDEEFDDQAMAHATGELTAWLASNNNRLEYCDTVMGNIIENNRGELSTFAILQAAHHDEYREVYNLVAQFLEFPLDDRAIEYIDDAVEP